MGSVCSKPKASKQSILAYKNFVQYYVKLHSEMLPNDAFFCATRLWNTCSPAQRMRYTQMGSPRSGMLKDVLKLASKKAKKSQMKSVVTKKKA
ncbi:uncharacterized protein LOC108115580 [Drosophila eugracilis]|uniref:uncharacterized protein LOC108115580 n=1 Tax=Drosophila eugracilis TaxID=29029 RepID=UPI0007E71731|nr:uncharacterized protein LOC108115580 [Drosophila eugracilis]